MSQKSFLDNKKSRKNFPYVGGGRGGSTNIWKIPYVSSFLFLKASLMQYLLLSVYYGWLLMLSRVGYPVNWDSMLSVSGISSPGHTAFNHQTAFEREVVMKVLLFNKILCRKMLTILYS